MSERRGTQSSISILPESVRRKLLLGVKYVCTWAYNRESWEMQLRMTLCATHWLGKRHSIKKLQIAKKSEFKSYYYELMCFCLVHPTLHISFLLLHRFALYRKMRRFFTSENTTKSQILFFVCSLLTLLIFFYSS